MFKPLGLFASSPCPDEQCSRPQCFFSHHSNSSARPGPGPSTVAARSREAAKPRPQQISSSSSSSPSTSASVSTTKGNENIPLKSAGVTSASAISSKTPATSVPVKRESWSAVGESGHNSVAKRARIGDVDGKGQSSSSPVNVKAGLLATTHPPSVPMKASINLAKPPSIVMGKTTPQPFADRQKALQTLYTQYVKLYSDILTSSPTLAHESAIAQELETSAASPNLRAYKTAIHHAAVSISRRPKPTSLTHPSVGTVKQSKAAIEAAQKEASGRLTSSNISQYCLPVDDFEKWSYPDPRNKVLTTMEPAPSTEGTTQSCDRCNVSFVVDSKNVETRFGECLFHHGRTAPELVEGRRKWIYSCCGKERGSTGCEESVHVFSDRDDDLKLASRWVFKTTKQVAEEGGAGDAESSGVDEKRRKAATEVKSATGGWADIVAIDCEMIYTVKGSSLARVSVVDEKGNPLLDEFVRQVTEVLDYNTRFSGVSKTDLDKAVLDLPAARAAVCAFVGPDTIIVGHGLENDLRALRLLHSKVVDTAIIFPHDRGPPYRRSLRDLVKENLGYFIQDRTADLGHSSLEDAQATLELLRFKVREDNRDSK